MEKHKQKRRRNQIVSLPLNKLWQFRKIEEKKNRFKPKKTFAHNIFVGFWRHKFQNQIHVQQKQQQKKSNSFKVNVRCHK